MIRRGCGLAGLRRLAVGSVDLAALDLPYGATANAWDRRPDLGDLWAGLRHALAPTGAVVAFADLRLAADLLASAPPRWFRYDIVWEKVQAAGHLNANRQPMRAHELILVFSPSAPPYRPRMAPGKPYRAARQGPSGCYGPQAAETVTDNRGTRYPRSVLRFANGNGPGKVHPTQKPLDLLEYLIDTYSSEGQLVADPCVGSGTTAVAAHRLGRRFVGWETHPPYREAARRRLAALKARSCPPRSVPSPPA